MAAAASATSDVVLVIEDEPEIRAILRDALEREGFRVAEVGDGEAAIEAVRTVAPSLVILDLGLPRRSGVEVLREIRAAGRTPVIILSGQGEEVDRILGLELGADDFVTKPFSPREVAVRTKTVLRRTGPAVPAEPVRFGDLTIDLRAREVQLAGRVVNLTAREFSLVAFLASSPRQVYSADQLLQHVWGAEPGWQNPNTVGEHIYRIRRKLETDPGRPRWITTVRGAGYRFEP